MAWTSVQFIIMKLDTECVCVCVCCMLTVCCLCVGACLSLHVHVCVWCVCLCTCVCMNAYSCVWVFCGLPVSCLSVCGCECTFGCCISECSRESVCVCVCVCVCACVRACALGASCQHLPQGSCESRKMKLEEEDTWSRWWMSAHGARSRTHTLTHTHTHTPPRAHLLPVPYLLYPWINLMSRGRGQDFNKHPTGPSDIMPASKACWRISTARPWGPRSTCIVCRCWAPSNASWVHVFDLREEISLALSYSPSLLLHFFSLEMWVGWLSSGGRAGWLVARR